MSLWVLCYRDRSSATVDDVPPPGVGLMGSGAKRGVHLQVGRGNNGQEVMARGCGLCGRRCGV